MAFLRNIALLLAACWLALAGPPAAAQGPHIRASLLAERPAKPGETITLAVLMQPDKGWHGYWTNPGDAGLPITLEWTLPPGAGTGALEFPVPQTLLLQGLMNHVYEHDYAVLVPFTVPKDAAPGTTLPISAKANWLACTDAICVPESATLQGTVTVGSGAADARFDGWRAALPAPLDRQGTFAASPTGWRIALPFPAGAAIGEPHFFIDAQGVASYAKPQAFSRVGDTLVIELAKAAFPSPEPPATLSGVLSLGTGAKGESLGGIAFTAAPGAVPTGGTPLGKGSAPAPFSAATLVLAILGALVGGLILNVMPCVFPILSLKAMALARAGSHNAHVEGLAYTAGVMLACMGLGAAMLALRAAGTQVGWAFQLQDPGVVALLLLLAVAITANFMGLYELPGLSIESGGGTGKGGWVGAFGTGLLAAFVATPCTGPFMAAAVGAALVLPAWAAMAVFAALGFGLALPFLLLGFVPALRRLLPKPGAWMERFRRAMAVPMGLTVLALCWLAWRLGGPAYAAGAIALAVLVVALLIMIGRAQRQGLGTMKWALPGSVALAALALAATPRLATAGPGGAVEAGLLDAKPFSEAALAAARAEGKPVFAYFTADWCLSCKVNEAAAIERETTRGAFRKAGVVVLVGDWTRRDPKITSFLAQQGAAGVPLYLWYPAKAAEPQKLPQVLSADFMAGLPGGSS
ncbi:protein-disulfide reductase DsbD domain-containing protein [Novosphingobium sp.]|uniref:protein-disulfide reductase DsbD family protein n=1 Tax=Novosphingobium sp. TaxID=1874826 RepID=UPI002612FEA8|nr:protein-disulfide reductase DsbD domain-containing protein [Novosphingobium sp.]